jgi:hypothetical protein
VTRNAPSSSRRSVAPPTWWCLLLDALDVLPVSYVAGQQPSAGDVERLTKHSALWRQQLEKLRSRLASLTIEPPTRPQ